MLFPIKVQIFIFKVLALLSCYVLLSRQVTIFYPSFRFQFGLQLQIQIQFQLLLSKQVTIMILDLQASTRFSRMSVSFSRASR